MGPLHYGLGWILDVALHPDYAGNGWIYLSFGDRCTDCGAAREIDLLRPGANYGWPWTQPRRPRSPGGGLHAFGRRF